MAHLSEQLANYGRYEDHPSKGGMVAHISGKEASLLEQLGGAGTINPVTGLKEFYDLGWGTWSDEQVSDAAAEHAAGLAGWSPAETAAFKAENMAALAAQADNAPSVVVPGITNKEADKLLTKYPNAPAIIDQHEKQTGSRAAPSGIFGIGQTWEDVLDAMWNNFSTAAIQRGINKQEEIEALWNHGAAIGALGSEQSNYDPWGAFVDASRSTYQGQVTEALKGLEEDQYRATLAERFPDQFNVYESLLSAARRGDYSNLGIQNVIEGVAGMTPGVGTAMTLAGLLGAVTGTSVIGTITDPATGRSYTVHEDGTIQEFYEEDPTMDGADSPNTYEDMLLSSTPSPAGQPFNRQSAVDQLITDTLANTVNPGIDDSYFDNIIRQGIIDRNNALGENVTQQQFEGEFGSSILGQELLGAETDRVRGENVGNINKVFNQQAFIPMTDDEAVSNILGTRRGEAMERISQFGARGNLNPTGGQTANAFITGQEPAARERLEQIGAGVREGYQSQLNEQRDAAIGQAQAYNLGDELFDIGPVITNRFNTIEQLTPNLQTDISSGLGAEQLFNTQSALSQAAQQQGLVSGGSPLLDVIAEREGAGLRGRQRGLGTRGSGTF